MIGLDTNVLVRYIMRDDPTQTVDADALMATLTPREPGLINPIVLAELWWVLGASYHRTSADRCALFTVLLDTDELKIVSEPAARKALSLTRQGADFADALIAEMNSEAGVTTATFDRDAIRRAGMVEAGGPVAASHAKSPRRV